MRPVPADLVHANGRTYRHDGANSHANAPYSRTDLNC